MPAQHVYRELVRGPDDVVGALAYSLYKQTKVDWLTAHKANHSGADPSPEQEKIFYAQNVLPVALQGYRDRAEMLAASFLETAIRAKINELALSRS